MRTLLTVIALSALVFIPRTAAQEDDQARLMAYAAAMRSDLRNLVVAQEMYFADHVDYARSLPKLGDIFTPSQGVRIVLLTSSDRGWSGIAIHENAPGYVCAMYVGYTEPPLQNDAAEGEPTCKDPEGKRFPPG